MLRRSLCVLGLLLAMPAHAAATAEPRTAGTTGEPFIRVLDDDDSGRVSLQIAARTFRRGPAEPSITLVGAAHIGEPAYYDALQALLDAHDLVLFEGVGPVWARLGQDATPADRINATRERLRTLAIAVESRRRRGDGPDTLDALPTGKGYEDRLLRTASRDAWGHPIRYTPTPNGFDLTSLGADGVPGGVGADADISLEDLPPLQDAELDTKKGIQSMLAHATGLVFQLDAIDYDKPGWRNSDTTAEALAYAMAGHDPAEARPGNGSPRVGGAGEPLFDLMRGEGLLGRFAGGMLKLIGSSPRSRAMLRLMLIETLSHADELLGMDVEGLDNMMDVLLEQRNRVVLEDIRGVLDLRTDRPRSVAVFYGAGHLSGLEDNLKDMGYRPESSIWYNAVTVDPIDTGLSPQQIRGIRNMVRGIFEAQLQAAAGQKTADEPDD